MIQLVIGMVLLIGGGVLASIAEVGPIAVLAGGAGAVFTGWGVGTLIAKYW